MTSTIPLATAEPITYNNMDNNIPVIEAKPYIPYSICGIDNFPKITVYEADFRSCLKDMADTITRLDLWDWFHNSPPMSTGYIYWDHENKNKISNGLKNNQHSGATFAYCMRQMQAIANKGFDKWKEDWNKKIIN